MFQSTEENINKADIMLENIGNNLKKFLELDFGAESNNQSAFYKKSSNIDEKRQHFKTNLDLIEEGRTELHKAVQENLENKFVSR